MEYSTDRVIVITGASRGIGEACARYFASSGARVVLAARDTTRLDAIRDELRKDGATVESFHCDVSDALSVSTMVDSAVERFGRVDVLVNNAGTIEPIAHLAESEPGAWGQVIDINLKGVYYAIRYSLPHMLRQGSGFIINISSGAASSPLEGWSHYCASKAAVYSLTQCVNKEYGEKGIRVVGLSPGTVATDMQHAIRASGVNPVSQLSFERHISPEWVARAIDYLCTEEGAQYAGTDFSLKTGAGRAAVGLPPAD